MVVIQRSKFSTYPLYFAVHDYYGLTEEAHQINLPDCLLDIPKNYNVISTMSVDVSNC